MITATLGPAGIGAVADPMPHVIVMAHDAQAAIDQALQNDPAVKALGLTSVDQIPARRFMLYQAYHESGAFSSDLSKFNNLTGIKFANQPGATRGTTPNHYANFNSLNAWADALVKIISRGGDNAPILAKTVEDYAHRLKENKYYEDTEDNYLHGLTRARLVLDAIPAEEEATASLTSAPVANLYNKPHFLPNMTEIKQKWQVLPLWGKVAVVVGGVFVIKKIVD